MPSSVVSSAGSSPVSRRRVSRSLPPSSVTSTKSHWLGTTRSTSSARSIPTSSRSCRGRQSMVMVLEGPEDTYAIVRTMMGATNPAESPPGTIRGDFGTIMTENLVHGSDSQRVRRSRDRNLLPEPVTVHSRCVAERGGRSKLQMCYERPRVGTGVRAGSTGSPRLEHSDGTEFLEFVLQLWRRCRPRHGGRSRNRKHARLRRGEGIV